MKKRITRCLALLLAVVMILSVMPVAMAEETTQTTWTKTTLSDITEADTIAITMTKGNDTWILPTTGEGSKKQPLATEVAVKDNTLTTSGSNGFGWTIAAVEGGYHIKTGSKYLYLTAENNGMRIGKTISVWSLSADHYLTAKDSSNTSRYLGVFNGTDWRCYDKTTGNIAGQTLNFWKLDAAKKVAPPTADPAAGAVEKGTTVTFSCETEGATILIATDGKTFTEGTEATVNEDVTFTVKATKVGMDDSDEVKFVYTVKAEEPATVPISTALAGEKDASFTVKGVVTLVDGLNYYLQDETGGICLRLASKTTEIALGDTIIGTGKRDTFNSLPQLGSGTFQKSSGLTLRAKSTTIDKLTTADVCTYVTISGVEVTEVYDKDGQFTQPNITVKDADGKTIQLYKAVINKVDGEWEYKVGDTLDITAAVSIFKDTLQLRNTNADEVKRHSDVYDPISDDMIPEGALNVKEAGAITTETENVTVIGQVVYHYGKNYNGKASIDSIILEDVIDGEIYGYQIYDYKNYAKYVVGDIVKVTGTVSPYGGVPQLKPSGAPEVIKSGLTPIAAQEITVFQMGADYLSEYVYIKDVTLSTYNASGSTTVTDATGTTNLFKGVPLAANVKEADVVALYACCSAHNGTYQLRNGSSADYVTNTTPPPSGDLPQPGDKFVIYNQNAQAVLAEQNDNTDSPAINKAAATLTEDGKAVPANGAVVFTVEQNGEYLRFYSDAYGYLCSNGTGNNAFYSRDFSEEGVTTDDADWLVRTCSGGVGGYELESRTAKFSGHSQWLEYFSDSFKVYSMYSKTGDLDYTIYSFFFYPVADGVNVDGGLVVQPTITFPETMLPAYVGSNYEFDLEIDTIYAIDNPWIEYSVRDEKGNLVDGVTSSTDVEVLGDFTTGKGTAHITVWDTQIAKAAENGSKMTLTFAFKDIKGNEARASCTVDILDEPVITNVTPAQGAQTGENKKPTISAEIVNAGENASVTMTVNGEKVDAAYANGKVTYTPAAAMADGKVTVTVTVKRADNKETSKTWSFTIGEATFQRCFGQLHSHTQYSDGAGSLESALAYIKALPDSANVDFVAFTDHSNYFDKSGAANPEGALYDMSLASAASQNLWNEYKSAVAAFNKENAGSMVAIAGFEMTWSGGPGHINTFNTPGIVSRNNTTLNNKTKDAGLQAYYELLSQQEGTNSISQFNHPGTTFGNFIDFGYWDAVVDTRMYMVEVGNGEGQIGAGGYYPSYEQYIMALDKGWHVAPTNNQDNHKGRWGDANDARDVILTDEFTEDGIYEALRARRMYATEDKNLELDYTVNGSMMGSIIDVPETLNFEISFNDPDRTDSIAKVELVVNSGKVAYTWNSAADLAKGSVSVELPPEYTYYFVRVTEGDGDLAVTAPVWVGESLKLGISKAECGTSTPVTNEELTITTTFFNSEAKPATIKSITYAIGSETISTDTTGYTLAASSTQDVEFKYTPTKARIMTVRITAVIEQDGKEYTFTKDVTLDVLDAGKLVYIGIDASHYNEYVAGNYKDNMGNFGELAAAYSVRTVTLKTSEELIAACGNSKYKAIILTAPSRRLEAAQKDPRTYSAAELEAIAAFNNAGGMVIVAGWSDNYENYDVIQKNPAIKHMAATQNEVLAKLGSSLRISDDGTLDDKLNGGQPQRLYFSSYNLANPLMDGVEFDPEHPNDVLYTERFSQYGGASIYAVGTDGNPISELPGTVDPMVYGHATTYSKDQDSDGLGGAATPKYAFAKNDPRLLVMATEQLAGKGMIIVSGAAFMSNFEVQAKIEDSGAEKNYSNYKICQNLVSMLNQTEISSISAVQAEPEEGVKFTVEGIVTSNASGYDKDTAFFDCIYVQDNTAGINAFPVAGNFKIGDKVRVTGTTSSYQGERQLAVTTKIEKIADAAAPAPVEVTAAQINDGSVLGSLVKIKGTITRVEEAEGKIQTIMVRDAAGNEARVFIDGYITKDKEVQNAIVGNQVEAVGLASYDNTFVLLDGTPVYPRIRIRDRADVVCTAGETPIKTWNITYVTDGGTINGAYPTTYTEGTVTVLPTNVTKSGYTFLGWFTAYTGGVQVRQIGATETGDKVFYAHWKKNADPIDPIIPILPGIIGGNTGSNIKLPFGDVTVSDWFYDDVRYVYANGIMDGTSSDRFAPNAPLTRAMIVTILYRMAGSPAMSGASDFKDVDSNKWFAKAVAWAAANGIVNGYGSGLFGPNDPVTREQLAAILYRYTAYCKASTTMNGDNLASFTDLSTVSGYALESMNWAVGEKLLKGANSKLDPKANATRAQVAAIIHRYLER